jgi:hypothetical protein
MLARPNLARLVSRTAQPGSTFHCARPGSAEDGVVLPVLLSRIGRINRTLPAGEGPLKLPQIIRGSGRAWVCHECTAIVILLAMPMQGRGIYATGVIKSGAGESLTSETCMTCRRAVRKV